MRQALRILIVAIVALAFLPAPFAGSPKAGKPAGKEAFKRLTVDEVEKLLNAPDIHIYDGNSTDLYAENHVPGAVTLYSKDIKEGVLPAKKDTPLIFYCAGTMCMECHHAADKAIALGYTNVSIMPDGIAGWVKAGKPVVKGNQPA